MHYPIAKLRMDRTTDQPVCVFGGRAAGDAAEARAT